MEPEVAFCDLKGIIEITDDMLKNVIANTLKNYPEEMKFLDSLQNNKLIESLNNFINKKLTIIEYKDVVENLKNYVDKFEEKDIFFGMDLASEHEKFLAENIIKGPVAVINYPKDIKAFYMYQNDDGKTVAAFDLLVPGIGELVGEVNVKIDIKSLLIESMN